MKKIKVLVLLFLLIAIKSNAQVAVVNLAQVIKSMPEFAKLDVFIEKEQNTYIVEYNKKQTALNVLITQADSLYVKDKNAENAIQAFAQIKTATADLKAYADMANAKVQEFRLLVQKPYNDKIIAAIKVIAIRKKLIQVIDSTSVNTLYLSPLGDITAELIDELKKE